jgi:hypothetical protein
VSTNGFGASGAESLSLGSTFLSKLNTLNILSNSINDSSALGRVLPTLEVLVTLNLESMEIADIGAASLSVALPHLSRLNSLKLSKNQKMGTAVRRQFVRLYHRL